MTGPNLPFAMAAMGQSETVADIRREIGIAGQTIYRRVNPDIALRAAGERLAADRQQSSQWTG